MSTYIEFIPSSKIDLQELKTTEVHLVLFGHGNVGSQLISQITNAYTEILEKRNIRLSIFAIANSTTVYYPSSPLCENWQELKQKEGKPYNVEDIINVVNSSGLKHVIVIDNTADAAFTSYYEYFIKNDCHLISSNKVANASALQNYKSIRKTLANYNKEYLYETNVGAGLPLIDTIRLLHLSGENITRIKGVFSGSLSYIFNRFSASPQVLFSDIVKEAVHKGFTEPDPREDLAGNDVARKLLIVARELELANEFEDIAIENLIPKSLRQVSKETFFENINELDTPYSTKHKNLKRDEVLRYIGDLRGDLSKEDGAILEVKLARVPLQSMLGQLKGSDSIFEIYTESYGDNPIVIQGAGAGAAVTARGVFGDIMRLAQRGL